MSAYAISLGHRRILAFNRAPMPENGTAGGWRPFVWTRDLTDAEKFASEAAAALYGRGAVKHDAWTVICLFDDGDCA